MPCNDDGYPPSKEEVLASKTPFFLCALVSAMGNDELDALVKRADWKEAGVSHLDFLEWVRAHQERDRERREFEEKEARKNQLIKSALAKLTQEELEACGVIRKKA